MIKLVFCVKKRDDIDRDEFYRYWKEEHGPLVKSYKDILRIKKYVQSHTCHRAFGESLVEQRGMLDGYDGLAELWWESLEDLQQAMETKEAREANVALVKDEARFINLSQSTIFISQEHEII